MAVVWGRLKFTGLGSCYFEVNRSRADAILMRPDVCPGQYLLRPSETSKAVKSAGLSVRMGSEYRGASRVEHYEVTFAEDGTCHIEGDEEATFSGIEDLLDYYKESPLPNSGNTMLTEPVKRDMDAPSISEIVIPKSKITKGNRLGAGAFGEVFKGKYGRLDVAIKQLERDADDTHRQSYAYNGEASPFRKEAALLASLSHENIVRIVGVSTESKPFWMITEFMNKGGLDSFLKNDAEAIKITITEVYRILHCIVDGMTYLEEKHVVHCDLRTSNVLVHDNGSGKDLEIKVADFGLTKVLRPDQEMLIYEDGAFPVRWTAPEAIDGQFSSKSDVWSFGCLAFEVVTLGKPPYPDIRNNEEVVRHVQTGNHITLRDCQTLKRPLTNAPPVARETPTDRQDVEEMVEYRPGRNRNYGQRSPYYTSDDPAPTAAGNELCPERLYNHVMAPCFSREPGLRPSFRQIKVNIYLAQYDE